ncbi:hypothetical protein FORC066_3073 [Yersinia enterocolitica]|nr:hypothetical protein FORC066_3073 [Yersinia enterocolitica]
MDNKKPGGISRQNVMTANKINSQNTMKHSNNKTMRVMQINND